jgi:hypothetical protein
MKELHDLAQKIWFGDRTKDAYYVEMLKCDLPSGEGSQNQVINGACLILREAALTMCTARTSVQQDRVPG